MKKRFLCFLLSVSVFITKNFAQNVAINEDGTTANSNAILDIKSFNKGVLIPRVSTTGRLAIPNTKGLLLFDTTAGSFFFNTGTAWQSLAIGNSVSTDWSLNGNSGINAATQFIGTLDNQPLRFRVNNTWAGELNLSTGNTSLGVSANQLNSSGVNNTAIGRASLYSNTTGYSNTGLGNLSLYSNTTAYNNTAVGSLSLYINTTGSNNTATGVNALWSNTTGGDNTANGVSALQSNTSGFYNMASGYFSMTNNTTGSYNTAVGGGSLSENIYGQGNTAVGSFALTYTDGSSYNTAVGYNASSGYNVGWNNTFIGANSSPNGNGLYNCVAIGESSRCTSSNQVRLGNSYTTSIGGVVGFTNLSDGRYKRNIKEDVKGLDFIMKLRPVTYQLDVTGISKKLKESHGKENDEFSKKAIVEKEQEVLTGFVAQEVEKAAKESGYNFSGVDIPKNENEFYGLRYSEFVVPLVKAVQEQQQAISTQKLKMEQQDKNIAALQKQIEELKQLIQHSK